jgi:hypothetical protein
MTSPLNAIRPRAPTASSETRPPVTALTRPAPAPAKAIASLAALIPVRFRSMGVAERARRAVPGSPRTAGPISVAVPRAMSARARVSASKCNALIQPTAQRAASAVADCVTCFQSPARRPRYATLRPASASAQPPRVRAHRCSMRRPASVNARNRRAIALIRPFSTPRRAHASPARRAPSSARPARRASPPAQPASSVTKRLATAPARPVRSRAVRPAVSRVSRAATRRRGRCLTPTPAPVDVRRVASRVAGVA